MLFHVMSPSVLLQHSMQRNHFKITLVAWLIHVSAPRKPRNRESYISDETALCLIKCG